MIKIKIDGKPHELPETWDEVTFEMFLKLINATDDYTQILSIMLNIPEAELRLAKIQGLDLVIRALSFMSKQPQLDEYPTKLGTFDFPKDITFETVEQFEDTRKTINSMADKSIMEQTEALALYSAIYCQVPYDSEKAQYLSKQLYSLPCTEVMAAGSFFQAKCLNMHSGLSMSYLRKSLRFKKKRLDFRSFLKPLASTRLWIVLRVMWAKMTKKY
jgi:hypothetical protein